MLLDPLAITAIVSLVTILAVTIGLIFWVMKKSAARPGEK